jgi:hypothetical protein
MVAPVQQASPADLFVRLRALTRRREDLFTECLAAVLAEDLRLAREFVRILAGGNRIRGANIGTAPIRIEPQRLFVEDGCRPDMIVRVGDAAVIGLEHKLLTQEGKDQIERYARLEGFTHFAVIAARPAKSSTGVLSLRKSGRLLAPAAKRDRFLWADFYDLIAAEGRWTRRRTTLLQQAMRALLDKESLQSTHPQVGYFEGNARVPNEADQRFYPLWETTIRGLKAPRRDWAVASSWAPGAKSELWAEGGQSRRLTVIRLDPRFTPGNLRVLLKAQTERARDSIERAVDRAAIPFRRHVSIAGTHLKTSKGEPWAVEVLIPWRELFRQCRGPGVRKQRAQMERVLAKFVLSLVDAAS